MAIDQEMSSWTDLLHSSTKLLEQAVPSAQFPPLQVLPPLPLEMKNITEQQTVLRQLEAILSIHKLAKAGHRVDALREVAGLSFLPFEPRAPEATVDVFQHLSTYVQDCVPDLLKVALYCMDNVADADGSLRALRAKIASFLASNMKRNWPRDLYEKVARTL